MKLLQEKIQRLGIYFFYDKDGIVDGYVEYFLNDLIKSLHHLIIVCNGKLSERGKEIFNSYTKDVIVRENKGLDVGAYKCALEYVGWETCRKYDEVILCNSTSMGPVYPFKEMFNKMKEKDVDFWGITKTHMVKGYDFGNPYGYLPEHVQSYFIVYRKSLLQSFELQKYWDDMPEIGSYEQSVGLYESVFTKYFSDLGFKWDVYVNTDDFEGVTDQPLMHYPEILVRERKCPIFKRRSFFHTYSDTLNHTAGQSAILLYQFLKESRLYDINLIWDNILRCYSLSAIAKQLHLNYTLSTKRVEPNGGDICVALKKIGLFMHLYFQDTLDRALELAKNMPEMVDIFITTDTEQKKKRIEQCFSVIKERIVQIKVVENRGRDVSALLIGMGKEIANYELVCYLHDKKSTQTIPGSIGESFAFTCYSNVLYNRVYVENIINLFKSNERLGMAVPPAPMHGEYAQMYGQNWGGNYDNTKKLCEKLGLNVSISELDSPIAPYGSVFWFRPRAMRKLFEHKWKYSDFPEEPLPIDGTISHAIERSYSFVAQDAGFYSAVVMSDLFERIAYTNLNFMISDRGYEKKLQIQLNDIYDSTSWKVTKPIRILGDFIKNISDTKVGKK